MSYTKRQLISYGMDRLLIETYFVEEDGGMYVCAFCVCGIRPQAAVVAYNRIAHDLMDFAHKAMRRGNSKGYATAISFLSDAIFALKQADAAHKENMKSREVKP